MNLNKTLNRLTRVIIDETKRNPEFEAALKGVFAEDNSPQKTKKSSFANASPKEKPRAKNRRPAALFDPVQLAKNGEAVLREQLSILNLEQLRDIVAEYGMDTEHLVMKWKVPERVVDRIVEIALMRANKGNAFRNS